MLLFSKEIKGTHIIGGEINYKCLGNDQFEVSLTVYRDCFYGVPFFDNPASVGFFDQNNNLVNSVGINGQLRMYVRNNDTLSPILEGRCIVVPPDVCVHTTTYLDTIELPYLEGGYFLSYQRCCRNETILNIIDPDDAGASFTAKISEKALLECNNSATFNEWPPIYICANQPIDFDHSATDIDGDSLVYKLCEPLMGVFPNNPRPWPPHNPPYPPVNWNEPDFSFDNKLGGTDPLKIDSQTGLLTGTPTIVGQFVVGVCVEEYRDGELISTTNRDFQYNVGECNTTTAAFFTADSYCDQLEVSFENLSENSFGEIWYFGGVDNPLDTSIQSDPTFTFPDFGTYDVTLVSLGLESGCNDTITKQIRLLDIGIDPLINVEVGECTDTVSLTLGVEVLSDSLSDFTYLWQVEWGNQKVNSSDSLFEIRVSGADSIEISLRVISTELGCWRTVDQKFPTSLILEDGEMFTNFLCTRDTIGLFPNADTSNNYAWSPENLIIGPSDVPNPSISPEEETLYTAQISNEFCNGEISVLVGVFDTENDRIVPDTICGSRTVTFDYNPFFGFATRTQWRFATDSTAETTLADFPTYTFPVYGDYEIRIAPLGFDYETCPHLLYQDIYIFDWDFNLDLDVERELCKLNFSVSSSDTLIPGSHEFQWVINGDTLLITGPEFEYEYTESESLQISVSVMNDYGCTVTKDTLIYTGIFPESTVIDTFLICGGDSIQLEVPFSPDYEYQWEPGKYFLTASDIHNPSVAPESNIRYSVDISNQLCTEMYFVDVEVQFFEFNLPHWVICDDLNPVFEVDSLHGVNFHWIFGGFSNPLAESTDINPQIEFDDYGSYPVALILHDTLSGCRDTFKSEVQLINSELWGISIELNRNECEYNKVQLGFGALLEGELPDGEFTFDWRITGDTVIHLTGDSIELNLMGVEYLEVELTVTDSLGCSHTHTIELNYDIFEIMERDTLYMCLGDTVFLNPDFHSDFDYVWSPATGLLDGVTHSNPSASPAGTTLYTASIFNGSCTGEKEVLVIVNENPTIVSLTADPITVLPEGESMLFAEVQPPGASILWSPAGSLDNPNIHNPLATPMETTTYFITVTSEEGCTTVDSITVFVQDLPCEIPYVFLPNAFSPNGDGMNDVLYVLGDHIERFVLIIYNRWGQEVFRTVELDRGWNGQFRGEDLPPDVYGYYLEVECIGGAHFSEKGNVSLMR
nr:gliding motility-associated C-terminal domain-containing protein [Saprospiraceae bacterium]